MDGNQLVEAVKYILEKEQSRLLAEAQRGTTTKARGIEIGTELEEVEVLIESARDGWED
jgi:hypothetical protein